jgi:ribosome maturation protein SDO1
MFDGIKFTKRFEKERLHVNLARLKKNGRNFEIVVDPDKAVAFRDGKLADVRELLVAEHVFQNAQKGIFSPESDLRMTFGTLDTEEIAEFILRKGELQLSSKYREEQQQEKRRKILEIVHRNAVNPQNNLPHPLVRLENAFEEAKIRVDDKRSAEDQVQDVIKKLKVVLPLKIEQKQVQIHMSGVNARKFYKSIHSYGKLINENWLNDGNYLCIVEIPAGVYMDLIDDLSKKTHGGVEIKVLSEKNKGFYE